MAEELDYFCPKWFFPSFSYSVRHHRRLHHPNPRLLHPENGPPMLPWEQLIVIWCPCVSELDKERKRETSGSGLEDCRVLKILFLPLPNSQQVTKRLNRVYSLWNENLMSFLRQKMDMGGEWVRLSVMPMCLVGGKNLIRESHDYFHRKILMYKNIILPRF